MATVPNPEAVPDVIEALETIVLILSGEKEPRANPSDVLAKAAAALATLYHPSQFKRVEQVPASPVWEKK